MARIDGQLTFRQIAASIDDLGRPSLFGLDAHGFVWRYSFRYEHWERLPAERKPGS
jgi:hypothetical protein